MKGAAPSAATHPNTFAWFVLIHRFSDNLRKTWTGAAAQAAPAKGVDKKAAPAKKEEPKKEEATKKKDDDDMDLFGDDDEEDLVSFFL